MLEDANSARADGLEPAVRRPADAVRLTARAPTTVVREDVRFEGEGCAISTASASLMTEAVRGQGPARPGAATLFERFHDVLVAGPGLEIEPASADDLGKLAALAGVRELPDAGQVRQRWPGTP